MHSAPTVPLKQTDHLWYVTPAVVSLLLTDPFDPPALSKRFDAASDFDFQEDPLIHDWCFVANRMGTRHQNFCCVIGKFCLATRQYALHDCGNDSPVRHTSRRRKWNRRDHV